MKKYIFAAALALAATAAHAGATLGVEYERFAGKNGASDSNAVAVVPAYQMGDLTLDAKLEHVRPTDGDSFNAAEVRAKYDLAVTDTITASVRGGVGSTFVDGERDEFYTVEPGVSYELASNRINLVTSYRFRDVIDGTGDQTGTIFYGAELIGTPVDTVEIKGFKETGDVEGSGAHLSYIRKF